MRGGRVRLTIGGLMAVVFITALGCWGLSLGQITPREQQALDKFKQAQLTREVAEYALAECLHDNAAIDTRRQEIGHAITDAARADRLARPSLAGHEREAYQARLVKSLQNDIALSRADEAAKREVYQRERFRRWKFFPF